MKRSLKVFIMLFIGCMSMTAYNQIEIITDDSSWARQQLNKIPIQLVNNQIIIELTLKHNLKAKFLLDTGVSTTIITEPLITSFLDLEYQRDINVKGYGREAALKAYVATNFAFSLNERYAFSKRPVIVLEEPLSLSEFIGEPIFGIIGSDIFKDYKIEINYLTETLRIISGKKPLKKRKFQNFDINVQGSKPYLPVIVSNAGHSDTINVLIDTGFSGALSLFPKEVNDKYIEDPFIPNYRGRGINGAIISKLKKLDKVSFGDYQVKNVAANFLDSLSLVNFNPNGHSDGGLGGEILKRFRVVFDYHNQIVSLRKNHRYRDPFNYNVAGIRIRTGDNKLDKVVENVRPASPSELAGLKALDQIIAINDRSTKYMNYERIYALVNDLNKPNKSITVLRNEEILTFEIFLQDIF